MTNIESTFENVINASIPANMSAILQANIDRARCNYDGAVSKLKSYAEASEVILKRHHAVTRQWNAHLIDNATVNVSAAFEVAEKLAKSKTVTDVANIHTEFVQAQSQRVLGQVQDAVSLAIKAGTEAFETWSAMVLTQFKKGA